MSVTGSILVSNKPLITCKDAVAKHFGLRNVVRCVPCPTAFHRAALVSSLGLKSLDEVQIPAPTVLTEGCSNIPFHLYKIAAK